MPSYEEVTQRAGSLRSLTGLTEAEFQAWLPHFEQAFRTYMDDRTIDGHPRTSRRYTPYGTCPWLMLCGGYWHEGAELINEPIEMRVSDVSISQGGGLGGISREVCATGETGGLWR
jgi:hypothetical protein